MLSSFYMRMKAFFVYKDISILAPYSYIFYKYQSESITTMNRTKVDDLIKIII